MAQNRIYTVPILAVASPAAIFDAWEVRPADDKPLEIMGLFIGQSSDVGDVNAENLTIRVIRGFTTSGSGGSTPTPSPLNRSDTAAGFSAETMNTTVATTGTTVDLHNDVWNTQAGYPLWLPEGCEWEASQADTSIVIRISAPADAVTVSGTLYVREQG